LLALQLALKHIGIGLLLFHFII